MSTVERGGPMATKDNVPDTVKLYNANDGIDGRNGGPYLDEEMSKLAEEQNARREGRKPNLSPSNLARVTHPGMVLVTPNQLAKINSTAGSSPSGEITAKSYGETANPVKVEQDKQAEKARIAQIRAENAAVSDEVVDDSQMTDDGKNE